MKNVHIASCACKSVIQTHSNSLFDHEMRVVLHTVSILMDYVSCLKLLQGKHQDCHPKQVGATWGRPECPKNSCCLVPFVKFQLVALTMDAKETVYERNAMCTEHSSQLGQARVCTGSCKRCHP